MLLLPPVYLYISIVSFKFLVKMYILSRLSCHVKCLTMSLNHNRQPQSEQYYITSSRSSGYRSSFQLASSNKQTLIFSHNSSSSIPSLCITAETTPSYNSCSQFPIPRLDTCASSRCFASDSFIPLPSTNRRVATSGEARIIQMASKRL